MLTVSQVFKFTVILVYMQSFWPQCAFFRVWFKTWQSTKQRRTKCFWNNPLTGSKFLKRRMSRHASCSLCLCSSVFGWVTCKNTHTRTHTCDVGAVREIRKLYTAVALFIKWMSTRAYLPMALYPRHPHQDWRLQHILHHRVRQSQRQTGSRKKQSN